MNRLASASAAIRDSGKFAGCLLLLAICVSLAAHARAQSPSAAADLPSVTFRREFKGSSPEFVEIVVRQDGSAQADVRQLDESPAPQEFTVGQAVASRIFDLAAQMKHFQNADLEVKKRIAYMGQKTFRWDRGEERFQTQYNYTADAIAVQLQKLFENLAQEQADLAMLEERVRFDRLGVNQGLDRLEDHLGRGTILQPQRFLAVLDRIAGDSRLIELARQRARTLAARIRVGQSQ